MTLDQCGETLGDRDLMALMAIKHSKFYALKRHGMLPPTLPGQPARYSKAIVEAWFKSNGALFQARRRSA